MSAATSPRPVRAAGELEVRCERRARRVVIELSGVLDTRASDSLADILDDAVDLDVEAITVDLRGVRRIDTRGVHTILVGHLRAADHRTTLTIVPGPPAVQEALERIEGPFTFA